MTTERKMENSMSSGSPLRRARWIPCTPASTHLNPAPAPQTIIIVQLCFQGLPKPFISTSLFPYACARCPEPWRARNLSVLRVRCGHAAGDGHGRRSTSRATSVLHPFASQTSTLKKHPSAQFDIDRQVSRFVLSCAACHSLAHPLPRPVCAAAASSIYFPYNIRFAPAQPHRP